MALLIFLGFAIPTNPVVIESAQGTLFVFGATSTAIVVAADGRTSDHGRPVGARSKLIQFDDSGVCFIGRYSLVAQYSDRVDFQQIVADWIKLNPHVSLPDAKTAIDKALVDSMKAFLRRNPTWRPDENDPFSYFICTGYLRGLPSYYETRFVIAPGGDVNTRTDPAKCYWDFCKRRDGAAYAKSFFTGAR